MNNIFHAILHKILPDHFFNSLVPSLFKRISCAQVDELLQIHCDY